MSTRLLCSPLVHVHVYMTNAIALCAPYVCDQHACTCTGYETYSKVTGPLLYFVTHVPFFISGMLVTGLHRCAQYAIRVYFVHRHVAILDTLDPLHVYAYIMYMYTHTCTCTHIHMHTHTHAHTYTCTHIHMHTHAHTCTYICATHTSIHAYTCT